MGCEQLATKADVQGILARLDAIESKIDNLLSFVTSARDAIINAISELKGLTNTAITLVQQVLDFLQNNILVAIQAISSSIAEVLSFLQNNILTAIQAISNLISEVFATIRTSIAALVALVQSLFGDGSSEEIDYSRIEQMLSTIRQQIINHIDSKIDQLHQQILDLFHIVSLEITALYNNLGARIEQAIVVALNEILDAVNWLHQQILSLHNILSLSLTALYNNIRALLEGLNFEPVDYGRIEVMIDTAKNAIVNHIDSKINWLHGKILELFSIVSLEFTALYNNIRALIDALNFEPFDYARIERAIVSIKDEILNRIQQAEVTILAAIAALGLLTLLDTIGNKITQILTLLDRLNNILELLNNLRDLFDSNSSNISNKIDRAKVEINGTILAQSFQTRNSITSLQSTVTQQSTELNTQIETVSSSIANVSASIVTVNSNIEGIQRDPINYDRINNHTSERINWLHQQILDLHNIISASFTALYNNLVDFITSKFGSNARTYTGTCVEGSYVDVSVESSTVLDSISALSNQIRAFHTGSCDVVGDEVVGLVANEKYLLRITGEQLVLHFVTEDNYPKRKSGSTYRPIQIPAPLPDYDWDTHFLNMRWNAGNQYAEMRLVDWKNPISGWFASKEAANQFFDYLVNNILDPTVEVDNIVIPEHSNPKTNITTQIWRPYRAYYMSAPTNANETTCLKKYYPGQSQ
jgi:hypothetical protein